MTRLRVISMLSAALAVGASSPAMAADPFAISNFPLFLAPAVKPNLMVILDNSQSMDATMAGKMIDGSLANTRGNIARSVLRNVLTANRANFNWGISSFRTNTVNLYPTHAFYLGDDTSMVYTNTCINGVAPVNNKRCIANPNPTHPALYVTYDRAGDDPDINDVTYHVATLPDVLYGRGVAATASTYDVYGGRDNTNGWLAANLANQQYTGAFSATDAGFLAAPATYPRRLWVRRGSGYYANVQGDGDIRSVVRPDSTTHFNALQSLLGNETLNPISSEIKNAAVLTPIGGTVRTVRRYFEGAAGSTRPSPITETCQSNFVVLATDGNPTSDTNGNLYSAAQRANTFNAATGNWTFGTAQRDVFDEIDALRSTRLNRGDLSNNALDGRTFDVKTYVIGMGDSVSNASSIAALNEMARRGGANPTAFLGNSEATLSAAFESIVGDIQVKTSTASSAAVNAGSWNAGSRVYQAKFNSADWSGNLAAYGVTSAGIISTTASWDSATRISAQNWDTGRNILTYKPSAGIGSRGIPFRWPANPASPGATEIDALQAAEINKDPAGTTDGFGADRLQFLRGNTTREPRNCATPPCTAPQFRNRPSGPLGDIVNSSPVFVGGPGFAYADDFESAAYSSFAATYRDRTRVLYVGANDGMLHAINAANGDELFAYVPSSVYDSLSKLSGAAYSHRFYVDGSPTVGDVFYGGAWHSLLVAGMRAGAKGLFALDVTNPANFSEANAASIVRWEFQDSDMGHVYGQPLIVKTNDGKWSVIVSGGYNVGNADGRAKLFVIDAQTGALVRKIDTGAGTTASPNGMSAPAAIDTNGDGVVDAVYAGDLNGNLWKFDLSSATPASWSVGNGGDALFAAGATRSITGAPDVTRHPKGGYLIGFGTGRYLAAADNSSTDDQAVYAVWDNLTNGTVTLAQLQQQTILGTATTSGIEFRLSSYAVGAPADTLVSTRDNLITSASYYSTKRGWYLELPTDGERVVTDATFRAGRLIFASMIPDSSTPCAGGGSGWLLEFDAITGNRLGSPTFDTNGDNALTTADFLAFTVAGGGTDNVSGRRIQGIPATPAFMSSGRLDFRLIPNSDATLERVTGGLGAGRDGRAMWREVR